MAAGKRRYTNELSRDTDRRRQLYVYGNAVPKPEFVPERQQEVPGRQRKTSAQVKKNRNRARQINPAYVMFLAVATVIAVVVCIHYLQLRAELTQHSRQITALQEELNDLTEKNDTAYSAAEDSVNLEELEEKARELGMGRPDEVINYESPDSDYVKQYESIPKSGVLAQSADVSE